MAEKNSKEDERSISIVNNILKVCKKEKKDGNTALPLSQCTQRVANYCGLSVSTIGRMRKMVVEERKPERTERSDKIVLGAFDKDVVRRTIFNMIERGEVPTARIIQTRLKEAINFRMGLTYLRKLLKEIGFYWVKCSSNRQVLMERSDVTVARLRYLRKMKEYRKEGRNIVYTDETYVHTTHSVKKCWQSDDAKRQIPFTRGERFIIVHAGSRDGFVKGAALVFKSGQSSGDYHNDMNAKNFQKWVTERLIPNLPGRSVLVVDNATYHNLQRDKCPTQATRKADIIDWLNKNNIAHSEGMLKPELVELCKKNKPEPCYILDDMLKEHGHDCIRLPPYHAELNAIELIWSQIKGRVAQCNTTFTATAVRQLIDDSIANVTPDDWQKCCRHVEEREEEFWKSNAAIERAVERFIIDVSDEEETDTASECSDYSETDSI